MAATIAVIMARHRETPLAVAAAEEVDQGVDGERLEGGLGGAGRHLIRLARVLDEEIGAHITWQILP
jgi:hypothetical protein